MLLKITEICKMNCIHCSGDYNAYGKDMEMNVFKNCIDFIKRFENVAIIVTGGEPTLHIHFKEIIEELVKITKLLVLTTNGDFDGNMAEYLSKLPIQIQVTNDRRYYPKDVPKYTYGNFMYVDKIHKLSNEGRAKLNNLTCTDNKPNCYNIRSYLKASYSLNHAMYCNGLLGKFCKPSIDIHGNIYVGENEKLCTKVGHVLEDTINISTRIRNMRCNNCKLFDKLTMEYRRHVNEV